MKNLISDKLQSPLYIAIFILISFFGFAVYILGVRSVTGDDLSTYNAAFDHGTFSAFSQARISHFFNAILLPVPYFIDSHIYYKAVQILTNIAFIVSIGVFLSILLKNKYLWYVYSILALTLWQNSDGHNLMVSYPFYVGFSILTFSISSIFFIYYLRLGKNLYLLGSLVAWILTSKGSEFYMMYFPLFFFVAFFESKKDLLQEKILEAFKNIKWHILITLLLFIAYAVFRVVVGASYGGRTLSFDFFGFINSLLTYSFGLAPGVQAYFNFISLPFSEFLRLIDLSIILVTSLVIFILIKFKERIQTIIISEKYFYLVILYLTLAPNLLISLTNKYQYYVSYHGVNNYLYSSFSFFTISVVLILALIRFKKGVYYYFLALLISIFVFLTQVNNKFVGNEQSHYSEKYFLLDALLDSSYLSNKKDGFKILAPALWDKLTVVETELESYWIKDAWTGYAKRKNKENISIERFSSDNDARIEYFKGDKKNSSFMIYSENGIQKAIFLSSKKCNKIHSCFLLTINNSLNGNVMQNAYIDNDMVYKLQALYAPDQQNIYGINTYELKGEIDTQQILMLTEYNPLLKGQKVINFIEGFYNLEHDGVNHWIWAFGDGAINVRSSKNAKVEFTLSLRAASERTISFKLNGETIKEVFLDDSHNNIKFIANLAEGDNLLNISTDSDPIKLSEKDSRVFSYAIYDISISEFQDL